MTHPLPSSYTAFDGHRRIASGPLDTVALAVKQTIAGGVANPVLIFDDTTGRTIDIDTRGSDEDMLARLAQAVTTSEGARAVGAARPLQPPCNPPATGADTAPEADARANPPRGRGRPKLGVVPREVTLLPRHWEWLNAQPGGASVALRKLVEEARRTHGEKDRRREAHERAYHFMSAIAGDLPGFEEATRALFANDRPRLRELIAAWPVDVRDHAIALAFGDSHDISPSAH